MTKRTQVQVLKVHPAAELPAYQTTGSAGMDLKACLDETLVVPSMERRTVPTGLAFAIPEGYEMQVRARSGLASRHGIMMVNGPGTVDSDYRGEVFVLIFNSGSEPFEIEPGMRIAQAVFAPVIQVELDEVDRLSETDRGSGGLGSTGA